MAQALAYKLPYNNLSYGGLKTSQAAEHDLNNDPYNAVREFFRNQITGGLKEEVAKYINQSGVKASKAEHNLYGIWVGGNNYLEKVLSRNGYRAIINEMIKDENKPSFTFGDSPTALAYIQRTVQDIIDSMEALYNHGARHFAVAGLIDMSITPQAAKDSVSMVFYYLSLKHNEILKDALAKFRMNHADVKVLAYLDAAAILDEFLAHSKEFGLTDTKHACYTGGYVLGKSENGEMCANPNEYLFFDKVHPTTRAHCFVSYYILLDFYKQNILNKAPITLDEYISFCQGQN
jgi:phospholipase/lecithinase/hemolysin